LGTSWLTMGQVLSAPLVIVGVALVMWSRKTKREQVIYLAR
jgi:prolipoprotein diacylglyceryltransferase